MSLKSKPEKPFQSTDADHTEMPAPLSAPMGVAGMAEAEAWLSVRGIADIECITPDMAGVARGKMMPSKKFLDGTSLSLPSSVFMQTISGDYPDETANFQYPPNDGDLRLLPDLSTLCAVPWESDPTAQVICDMADTEAKPVDYAPRNLLKQLVAAYEAKGLRPIVAPEIEFYLVKANDNPDLRLEPPVGRSGSGGGRRSGLFNRPVSMNSTI